MLKKEVLAALNKQIQHELLASHSYLALSGWFTREVLNGFAAYMRKQAEEEREHAMRLIDYVQDRGGTVELGEIKAPKADFATFLDVLKYARDFERETTASINGVYALAQKENDLPTQLALQWFINEQVEEEKWADELVTMGEKIGASVGSLYMLDHRVGKRATEKE